MLTKCEGENNKKRGGEWNDTTAKPKGGEKKDTTASQSETAHYQHPLLNPSTHFKQ